MNNYSLGYKLRTLRKTLKKSQQDIADLLGYKSRQYISKFENDISLPSFCDIMKLCILCNKTLKKNINVYNLYDKSRNFDSIFSTNNRFSISGYDNIKEFNDDKIDTLSKDEVISELLDSEEFSNIINLIIAYHYNNQYYEYYKNKSKSRSEIFKNNKQKNKNEIYQLGIDLIKEFI